MSCEMPYRHYDLFAVAVACLQLFRECNYTGREVCEGTAKEAVDSITIAEETVREGLLAMGGEDIEEVILAKELLYFALSVFKSSECNICSKSWVSTCQDCCSFDPVVLIRRNLSDFLLFICLLNYAKTS